MTQGTTHIIGAGLAGLSAATALTQHGRRVIVHEASAQAGGRCRSYEDAALSMTIDNGNHLLLSGNEEALRYLERIGAPAFDLRQEPAFDFIETPSRKRWKLHLNRGRIPFWLMSKARRVPGTRLTDYFSILRLLWAKPHETISSRIGTDGLLYERLWHPLLLSALNTHPAHASAKLAGAVLRGTLMKGGAACVPLIADGLCSHFIDPALRFLSARSMQTHFNQRVKHIALQGDKATRLEFAGGEQVTLWPHDNVICAVPCWNLAQLVPDITVPDEHCAILNAHFRIAAPAFFPRMMGVINATTEWIFAFPDRISVTVSGADRLMQEEREELARILWSEVAAITGLACELPPWQIVKEKRATFAATPAQDARRPGTKTAWRNIFLAGDYVQTGLPATIEGAVRSGTMAAEMAMRNT